VSQLELERAIVERLDRRDLRYTAGRRAIVRGLRGAGGPVTLPELLDAAPDLAMSSAYRNLAQLEQAGVVRRVVTHGDHVRYELSEALTEHHHHLICDTCGSVRDVTLDDDLEARLHDAFEAVAAADRFSLRAHTIDLHGTCAECS